MATLRRAREQHEAAQRGFRLSTPVLLVCFVLVAVNGHPAPGMHGRGLVVSAAVAAFVVSNAGATGTILGPRWMLHYSFVAVLVVSAVTLLTCQPDGPGYCGALVGILFAVRRVPAQYAIPILVVGSLGLAVSAGRVNLVSLLALSGLGAFFGMMYLAVRLGAANKQAERLLEELARIRAAEAETAGLAERQRVAREMHDVLAHSLSGLMLQLEGARMLAGQDPTDPGVPEAIERAHRLGKSGLEEARRAIGMLRDDELPGPERLRDLAARFEDDHGIPCRLTVLGEEHVLSLEARLALYRVAQEALTNIGKHADPECVEISLDYRLSGAHLVVEDFRFGKPGVRPREVGWAGPDGYGLTGMRERAQLLGGTLIAATTDNGFRVELEVPA
jgi:signal transduction histidine kinase